MPWWRRAGRPVVIAMFVLTLLFLYSIASGYRLRARVRAKLDSEHVPSTTEDSVAISPFSIPSDWPPRTKRVYCSPLSSVRLTFTACAFSTEHYGLLRAHLDRENAVYKLLSRTFHRGKFPSKAFVDIGSNHGLMSIFASKSGAYPVVAVEPNRALAGIIRHTFGKNNIDDEAAVVYNAACLDTQSGLMEMVSLVNHHVGEGGIGTILRGTKSKTASAKLAAATRAVPLSQLLPSQKVSLWAFED